MTYYSRIIIIFSSLIACSFTAKSMEISQQIKYDFSAFHLPDNSPALLSADHDQLFQHINYRANLAENIASFQLQAHYQLHFIKSSGAQLPATDIDQYRLFDLTSTISEQDDQLTQHRLDRLSIAYTKANMSVKFGRQAVTWGNGFVFNVMDIFNPFSPTAIDTEYKTGDDMLYFQLLSDAGNDWQIIYLPRRDIEQHIQQDQSSFAVKLQTPLKMTDAQWLLARHYDDSIFGIGLSRAISDSLWRLDITHTALTHGKNITSLSTNIDYSWQSFGKNVYGFIEYYHNGFGIRDSNDTLPASLSDRLTRGELYGLYQNYLSAGLRIELHPLVNFSPTLINNLDDQSRLLNLSLDYSWRQNLNLTLQLLTGFGSDLSEFNGNSSQGDNLMIFLNYYF